MTVRVLGAEKRINVFLKNQKYFDYIALRHPYETFVCQIHSEKIISVPCLVALSRASNLRLG